jgi:release factor glutamine methyltransferase
MSLQEARMALIQALANAYDKGEAAAIARMVMEDAFQAKKRSPESTFTVQEQADFEAIKTRLTAGEPVQYILGEADFWGLRFKVSPAVLIPRQETEELVARVLEYLKSDIRLPAQPLVLDIGLGSGCIAITLKKKHPSIQVYGLEKSVEALEVATQNATQLLPNQDFNFILGDILDPAFWHKLPAAQLVVSNPPYIPYEETSLIPRHVLEHEPHLALFVEEPDPLLFYRYIAAFVWQRCPSGAALFLECNEYNAPQVLALLEEKGFCHGKLYKDLSGADRMVTALKP